MFSSCIFTCTSSEGSMCLDDGVACATILVVLYIWLWYIVMIVLACSSIV